MNLEENSCYDDFGENYQNPLDFLSDFPLKRKPRSSFESAERELEIPCVQPQFLLRRRRSSNRSRDFLDTRRS